MTPREVIPAEVPGEVEAEVSAALTQMVADVRRYAEFNAGPDPRVEKLRLALQRVASINNRRDRFSAEIDAVIVRALGESK